MRRSELSDYIKETIVELLSEETPKDPAAIDAATAALEKYNKTLQQTDKLTKSLEEDEDAEPTKAELEKTKSLAAAKEELAQLIKKMKAKAQDYKAAEGDAKEKIKDELKAMTAEKKKLEKLL